MSTRSSLSGAKRAVSSASTSASSRTCRLRASASMLRSELETMGATRKPVQLERERACVDSSELEDIVDEQGQRLYLLPEHGDVLVRGGEAVLDCLEHRLHVRERCPQVVARPRDELATRVEEPTEVVSHLVERRREVGDLGRAAARARAPRGRLAPSATDASRTRSIDPTIERARTRAATTAVSADAAVTARIFTSSPMWNITQPDSRTAPSGSRTARKARPASCSRTVGSRRRR